MRYALLLLSLTACFGRLELEGAEPPYGGPFDEQQAQALWVELADRESWPAFSGHEGIFESETPHGPLGSVHVNAIAWKDPSSLPAGAVIAKHDYVGEDALGSITAIQRIENFNPDAFDWFWARFDPSGEIERDDDGNALCGAIEPGCIGCHRTASGGDFVFLNDGGR